MYFGQTCESIAGLLLHYSVWLPLGHFGGIPVLKNKEKYKI